jgi:hypothetical protein
MSTTTVGTSIITPKPRFSIIRLNPGPDVAVIDLAPAHDAPKIAAIDASSSSNWMNMPPISGNLLEMCSATSLAGVIGYPAKNRQPAAIAPSATATSPYQKCLPVKTAFPVDLPPVMNFLSFFQPIWHILGKLLRTNRMRRNFFPSPVLQQPLEGDSLSRLLSQILGAPL